MTEAVTDAVTEAATDAVTEAVTDAVTEAATEAVTEAAPILRRRAENGGWIGVDRHALCVAPGVAPGVALCPFALWPPPIHALLRRAPSCAFFEPKPSIYR